MRFVGNIIWFVFGGAVLSLMWLLGAVLFALTIVGLPLSRGAIEMAKLSAFPFGKEVVHVRELDGKGVTAVTALTGTIGFVVNVIWACTFGIGLFVGHLVAGVINCGTSIVQARWSQLLASGPPGGIRRNGADRARAQRPGKVQQDPCKEWRHKRYGRKMSRSPPLENNMKWGLVFGAVLAFNGAAHADSIPRYDPPSYCSKVRLNRTRRSFTTRQFLPSFRSLATPCTPRPRLRCIPIRCPSVLRCVTRT